MQGVGFRAYSSGFRVQGLKPDGADDGGMVVDARGMAGAAGDGGVSGERRAAGEPARGRSEGLSHRMF